MILPPQPGLQGIQGMPGMPGMTGMQGVQGQSGVITEDSNKRQREEGEAVDAPSSKVARSS